MIAQRSLFDARCQYRDFYLGLHLWAIVRGDAVRADEYGQHANAVDSAIRSVYA